MSNVDSSGAPTAASGAAPPAQQRWIHRDLPRGWVSAGACFLVSFGYSFVSVVAGVRPDFVTSTFLAWDVYALVFILLTVGAFAGTRPEDLPALVRRPGRRSVVGRMVLSGEGPGTAVPLAAVALIGAALLPQLQLAGSGSRTLQVVVLILAVVLSWIVVVISYAVFYARRDFEERGLRFPDEEPAHGWVDYLYFSLSVAATFGTTDVTVTSSRMRRTVLTHTAITFVFNTVVIAILVAALSG